MSVKEIVDDIIVNIHKGNIFNHIKDEKHEEWTVQCTECNYRLVMEYHLGKTNRIFCKQYCFMLNADGSEKLINLGSCKTRFYTMMYCLAKDKIFNKNKKNPALINELFNDMRMHPENWTKDNLEITGIFNNKKYRAIREYKNYERKSLYRCFLYIDDVLSEKGNLLMKLWT